MIIQRVRIINCLLSLVPRAFSTTIDMQPSILRNYEVKITLNYCRNHVIVIKSFQSAIETLNNLQSNAAYLKKAAAQQAPSLKIPEVIKYLKR